MNSKILAFLLLLTAAVGAAEAPRSAAGADAVAVSAAGRRGQAPVVATAADGSTHVIWLDKGVSGTADRRGAYSGGSHSHQSFTDLYYARSDDGGTTFSAPIRVNATEGEVWGFAISRPQIAIGADGLIHVYYPVNAQSTATGKDVASSAYARSLDGGKSFTPALLLNTDPPEDLEAIVSGGLSQAHVFGDMSVADDGSVYVFWLDTREMNEKDKLASVYLRASHDNGASFADEQRLYLADACPCCQVTTVTGNDDEVYVASRRVNADNIRMPVVSVSRDGGASFAARVAVSGKPWQLDGCPLKPTALAVDGDYFYTLVHNGAIEPAGLLFSRSADAAASFEPAMVVHPDAIVSDFPVLVSHGDRLSAIWHAKTDGPRRLFIRTSTDHGESFGAVREIDTPPGASAYPSAAALPKGDLVVVWQQDEQILATRVKP